MNNLKVKDVMFKEDKNPVISDKDLLRKAVELMSKDNLGIVSIVDEEGKIKGIITDGDLRRILLNTQDTLTHLFNQWATDHMTKDPITVPEDMSLKDALILMNTKKVWVLPVIDKERKVVGLLHMQAVIEALNKTL